MDGMGRFILKAFSVLKVNNYIILTTNTFTIQDIYSRYRDTNICIYREKIKGRV